jgi:outer membrane receptor protein involved in Fe transport
VSGSPRGPLLGLLGALLWARAALGQPGGNDPAPPVTAVSGDIEQLALEDLLNPTVSTATKSVRTLEQTPAIVTVFRREDIHRLGVHQLIDLLRFVPGFYEVSSPLERNIAIRGVHAASPYHFVVLLDGMPVNDFLFSSSSPESFSLEYADRVEIIRGPGSAIYGANALMGVVNIITARAPDGEHAHAGVSVGTQGALRTDLSFSVSLGGKRSVQGAASFWRQEGTRFAANPGEDVLTAARGANISDGIQPGENLTAPQAGVQPLVNGYGPSFNLFLKYQHDDGSSLRVLAVRGESLLQRTHRQSLYLPEPHTQPPVYLNQRLLFDLEKKWGDSRSWGQLSLRPSFLLFDHELRSQAVGPAFYAGAAREVTPVISGWSGHDLRLGPTLEYTVDLRDRWLFRQTTLVVGTQAEYDVAGGYKATQCLVDTEGRFPPSIYTGADGSGAADLYCVDSVFLREGLIIEPFGGIRERGRSRYGDGDEVRLGGFFQLSTSLPHDVGLVVGGRVDYNITYSPQLSPRLALVAPIAGGLYTKAQFSSGFVYPAFLYRTGNALSEYQGNPDIEPQSIRTVEALIGWKGESIRTELSAYFNDVSRFITYDVAWNARTGEYRFSNQGDLRVAGLEGTATLALLSDRVLLDLQASVARPMSGTSDLFLVDGQLGGPSKYPTFLGRAMISVVPFSRLRLNVDASISTPVKQAIAPEVRFEGIAGTDGQPYTSRDRYDTKELNVNALATYSLADRWSADLAASNLLARRSYRPGSVLVPYFADGRRLVLTLNYRY